MKDKILERDYLKPIQITGIVNRPQFDDKVFKVGHPVKLVKRKVVYNSNNWGKFDTGDFGLIQSVQPLTIHILLCNNKVVSLSVDLVADSSLDIIVLGDK